MITKRISVMDAALTRINYVQGTTLIPLKFVISDFEIPENSTALLIVRKPSGAVVTVDGEIDRTDNSVTIEPTAQTFAESGDTKLQLQISVLGEVLNSYLVQCRVEPCIVTDDMVESSDDFSGLAKVVQDAVSVAYAAVADYCEANGITTGMSPEELARLEALEADMEAIKAGISGGTFDDWEDNGGEEEA